MAKKQKDKFAVLRPEQERVLAEQWQRLRSAMVEAEAAKAALNQTLVVAFGSGAVLDMNDDRPRVRLP